ncbi:MAG: hypothetical protein V4675_24675 [Verrucomicrobiota bacterium]
MKRITFIIAALPLLMPSGLYSVESSPTLTQDAAKLSSAKGIWKSGTLDIPDKDGSHKPLILVVEFTPFAGVRPNPPDASAKVRMEMPSKGVKGVFEFSVSVGGPDPIDVRLKEKDGVRIMTFTRAIETMPQPPPTQRILDEVFSVSFTYEFKDDALILKGFSTEGTTWGSLQFIAPEREITFKAIK